MICKYISLQDVACRSSQHCKAAFRCWDGLQAKCCWPPENHNQCDRPGLPNGWTAPGNDPAGVSNNEASVTIKSLQYEEIS